MMLLIASGVRGPASGSGSGAADAGGGAEAAISAVVDGAGGGGAGGGVDGEAEQADPAMNESSGGQGLMEERLSPSIGGARSSSGLTRTSGSRCPDRRGVGDGRDHSQRITGDHAASV